MFFSVMLSFCLWRRPQKLQEIRALMQTCGNCSQACGGIYISEVHSIFLPLLKLRAKTV